MFTKIKIKNSTLDILILSKVAAPAWIQIDELVSDCL